jgi:hypothetical protein
MKFFVITGTDSGIRNIFLHKLSIFSVFFEKLQ